MCFNMSIVTDLLQLEEDFGAVFEGHPSFASDGGRILYHQRSGFSHPAWPIIPAGDRRMASSGVWGLVPRWAKDREAALAIREKTLNARSETVRQLPSFRDSMKQQKRCLIPVSGFFEPHAYGGKSYPFYLHRKGELFALGGIYEDWFGPETGRAYRGFSVLTVPAAGIVDTIHNKKHRMPLLIEPGNYGAWLDAALPAEEVDRLMGGREYELFAHPVSRALYARDGSSTAPGISDIQYTGIPEVDNLSIL